MREPAFAYGCIWHALRRKDSKAPSRLGDAVLHSSMISHRMLSAFRKSSSISPPKPLPDRFCCAASLFTGIAPQEWMVFPCTSRAIEFCCAKHWNWIPSSHPRHSMKNRRTKLMQYAKQRVSHWLRQRPSRRLALAAFSGPQRACKFSVFLYATVDHSI